jgi:hypothetical protein
LNQLWPPLNFNSERDNVISGDAEIVVPTPVIV